MTLLRWTFLFLLAWLPWLAGLGCTAAGRAAASGPGPWDGAVKVHGALRAILHEGRTDGVVALDTLLPNPRLHAIGALADLAGEVTVVGGEAYLSYPAAPGRAAPASGAMPTRTAAARATSAQAALLVHAEVPSWQAIVTERPIRFAELDDEIERLARELGLDPAARLPFLVDGEVENLSWHVVDGQRLPRGPASHEDHAAAAVKERRDRTAATLAGFFSSRDQGVFTHMGERTHVHCVVADPLSSGHVEHVDLPAGITVRFPAGVDQAQRRDTDPSDEAAGRHGS